MRNNKGRSSGLYLIILLAVALLVAWLSMTQLGSLGFGPSTHQGTQTEEQDPVEQARDVVDNLNKIQQDAVPGFE